VRSGRSARPDPEGEEVDDKATLRKVMFFGTAALTVLCIGLFIWKAPIIFGEKPVAPKKVVIDENQDFAKWDEMARDARKKFAAAERLTDSALKQKGIQEAIDTVVAAREGLHEMGQQPRYQGEDFDAVFEPKIHKMTQELKVFKDALAKARAGR
jgi:hypothetical protein